MKNNDSVEDADKDGKLNNDDWGTNGETDPNKADTAGGTAGSDGRLTAKQSIRMVTE